MNIESTSPPTTCDGRSIGVVAQEWGFKSLPCNTTRGLVRYTDRDGIERAFCRHHRHYVRTRWPEGYVSEIADDPLGQEKARKEAAIERIAGLVDRPHWEQDHGGYIVEVDEDDEFDREGQPEFNGAFR